MKRAALVALTLIASGCATDGNARAPIVDRKVSPPAKARAPIIEAKAVVGVAKQIGWYVYSTDLGLDIFYCVKDPPIYHTHKPTLTCVVYVDGAVGWIAGIPQHGDLSS